MTGHPAQPARLSVQAGGRQVFAELAGPAGAPCFVLVNGLTQYAPLWDVHAKALVARGYRVATFDLFGQGRSEKPALFIGQDDQVAVLDAIIDQVSDAPVFVAGAVSLRVAAFGSAGSFSTGGASNNAIKMTIMA